MPEYFVCTSYFVEANNREQALERFKEAVKEEMCDIEIESEGEEPELVCGNCGCPMFPKEKKCPRCGYPVDADEQEGSGMN